MINLGKDNKRIVHLIAKNGGIELIDGIRKIEEDAYGIYYIDVISDEIKQAIRNHLVKICHGPVYEELGFDMYSYEATVEEFIARYKADLPDGQGTNRRKGMIGELLVHLILELENRFLPVSPYFNMEEKSFKKGYDVCLLENDTGDLWITEVKSGERRTYQQSTSTTAVNLLNVAKNDLKERLNKANITLWMNAINGANLVMKNPDQKAAVNQIIGMYASEARTGHSNSNDKNVVLSAVVFAPLAEEIKQTNIDRKYSAVVKENLFRKVLFVVIQQQMYSEVFAFLESEANK